MIYSTTQSAHHRLALSWVVGKHINSTVPAPGAPYPAREEGVGEFSALCVALPPEELCAEWLRGGSAQKGAFALTVQSQDCI